MNFHRPKDADRDSARVAIARHLDASGPTAGDELAEALGLAPERFWALINHPWFEITGKGWQLTDQGRSEGNEAG
jgi:hypothetical protein